MNIVRTNTFLKCRLEIDKTRRYICTYIEYYSHSFFLSLPSCFSPILIEKKYVSILKVAYRIVRRVLLQKKQNRNKREGEKEEEKKDKYDAVDVDDDVVADVVAIFKRPFFSFSSSSSLLFSFARRDGFCYHYYDCSFSFFFFVRRLISIDLFCRRRETTVLLSILFFNNIAT